MSGATAKVQHVLKLLRQTANFAEAAVPTASATTSTLPPASGWSENMKPLAPGANAAAPSFRAPAVNAPGSAWGPAPRRVPVLPPTQALPLPHIGSSALPPLQRYIDQLRLAQSLAQADDEQQQRQVQQQPHAVPSARMQALLAPYTSSTHAPSQQHLQGAEQEPTSASGRPRISHGLAKQPLLPGQQRQQQPLGTQAGRRQGGRASSAAVQLNKEIMAATTTTELLALVRGRGKQMDFFNISSAISRTPKLAGVQGDGHGMATHHPALDGDSRQLAASLAELMCEHITHFDARGLANSAWAFGKLRFMPTPTLPALIASQAIAKIDGFCAQNISNLAWAFVYMHHRDERVLSLLAQKICAKVDEFKPQELANVLWAFASLEYPNLEMMQVATQRAARIAPLFKEQELSNAIWAMGRLQFHNPQVFSTLLSVAASKLHLFLPQGIANIAWAMAALQHREPAMLARLASQCRGSLATYDAQALCNLAWSLASLGYYDRALMEEVVSEGVARVERLSPHNLASLLWACAQLGHQDPRMVSAWAQQVQVRLSSFEPSAAAALILSFHQLGCSDEALYSSLAGVVASRADACPTSELVGAAWALAASHASDTATPLLERLAERLEAPGTLDGCGPRTCAMAMWSFAATGQYPGAVAFESLLQHVVAGDETSLEPGAAAQALWACARAGHAAGPKVQLLAQRTLSMAPSMASHELADCAWALSTLQLLDESSGHLLLSCLNQQHAREGVQAAASDAPRLGQPAAAAAFALPADLEQTQLAAHDPAESAAAAIAELQQLMLSPPVERPSPVGPVGPAQPRQLQDQTAQAAAAMWQWQQALSDLPAPLLAAALLSKFPAVATESAGLQLSAEATEASAASIAAALASGSPASLLTAAALGQEASGASSQQTGTPAAAASARTSGAGADSGAAWLGGAALTTEQQLEAILSLPGWPALDAAQRSQQQQQRSSGWPGMPPAVMLRSGASSNGGAMAMRAAPAPLHMQHAALLSNWAAAAQQAGAADQGLLPHSGHSVAQHHRGLGGVLLAPLPSEESLGSGWEAAEQLLPSGLLSEGLEEPAPGLGSGFGGHSIWAISNA